MKISDLFSMGLRNLFRRKARTLLTVLGVVIGTISIVIMISVGVGMNESFQKSIMENGSMTQISVRKNSYSENEDGSWSNKKQNLDDSVVKQLKEIEHVKCVTPMMYSYGGQFYCGDYYTWPSIMIIDMDCYEALGYPAMVDGTYPTKEEAANTFYVGQDAIYEFYQWSGRSQKTKTVDLEKDKVVMKFDDYQRNPRKKEFSYPVKNIKYIEASESGYSESDYYIFMDFEFYKELYIKYANTLNISDRKKAVASLSDYNTILVNVDNMDNVTKVQDAIKALGYESSSDMQYIEPLQETAKTLEMVLGAIGAIAMLVSAINIANTMIMSIYERTREIGIMKVLGCKVGTVRGLFLFEAGMIGLMGGIIGIIFSYIGSWFINTYGSTLLGSVLGTGTDSALSVIPFWLPLFGAGFAMLIGLISGFIPAVKATKISAIEAMKTAE